MVLHVLYYTVADQGDGDRGPTMLLRQTEAEINFDEGPSLTLESG